VRVLVSLAHLSLGISPLFYLLGFLLRSPMPYYAGARS